MLPHVTRGVRVALILALSSAYIGWHSHPAYAKGGGDDDSAGDDDDDGGGGGDKKGDDDDDDDTANDKDQPPVTAGGLFTLKSYPKNENLRPLTLPQGITQLRFTLGTDLSAKGAFDSVGVSLEGSYGLRDNFMIIGGFTSSYNFKQFSVYGGIEASLIYDLLDLRIDANVHRSAVPAFNGSAGYGIYCDPPGSPNEMPMNGTCSNPMATQDPLPTGQYLAGGTQFSIDLGFPFRYAFKPQIALVALQTLITFDFNSAAIDHVDVVDSGMQDANMNEIYNAVARGNGAKPDFDPSVGIALSPIPQLSITAFAQLRIIDFDTAAGNFQIPLTVRVEATPTNRLDIGLQFTLLNLDPPDPQSPIDNRFLSLYAQYRL